jgi:SulP family sulfate permease
MSNFLKSMRWSPKTFGPDLGSGLTVALVSIPEGMVYAMVAGVDPVYGLYTGMLTTIVASLTGSTSLMVVTLTNALALVTGETLAGLGGDVDIRALFTLTLLVGVIMFVLGVLKLGSIIRFVSREVMSGFIFATALLIVLGQYGELVGYESSLEEANKLVKAVDITLHIGEWDIYTTIVGVGSIIVLIILKWIRAIEKYSDVLVILISSVFVLIIGWSSVVLVGDIAEVPSGLEAVPKPILPDLSLIPALLAGAIAASVVGLAEGSGVGSAYPNPDGSKSNMSHDFTAQGLGNMVGSFFQAMPAGASLSRTGLNVSGGAKTRWAGVYSGILLLVTIILFGAYTELIPMSSLAGLLIVIGFGIMVKESRELGASWKVNRVATAAAIVTIVVGVFEDLTVAIFAGVTLSLLIFTFESVKKVKVVELVRRDDGDWDTRPVPDKLTSDEITVIQIYGNIYFADVYSADDWLPSYEEATNAVLIYSMRGRESIDLTTIEYIKKLSYKYNETGNRLMLCGVEENVLNQMKNGGLIEAIGEGNVIPIQPQIGGSIKLAYEIADRWIEENKSSLHN